MTGSVSVGLHIGVHKTATTHLQNSLRDSQEALIAAGVRYYGPDYLRQRGRAIEQMFELGKGRSPRRSAADQIAFLAKGDGRVILSEENISGPLFDSLGNVAVPLYSGGAQTIGRFAELLHAAGIPLDLYVSVRGPATFLNSCYSQALLAGGSQRPDEFAANNRPGSIDWTAVIAGLAKIPHKRRLFVWQFEHYQDQFAQIVEALVGADASPCVSPVAGIVHQGLSAKALDNLLEARANGQHWLTPARARRQFPVSPQMPPFGLFGPGELARDKERYADQIARIAAIPGVSVIAPRGQG